MTNRRPSEVSPASTGAPLDNPLREPKGRGSIPVGMEETLRQQRRSGSIDMRPGATAPAGVVVVLGLTRGGKRP